MMEREGLPQEAQQARFFAGVKTDSEGKQDYSEAVYVKPGSKLESGLAETFDEQDQARLAERNAALQRLDEQIRQNEGENAGVFYQIQKSEFLAKERVAQGDERSRGLLDRLQTQKSLLSQLDRSGGVPLGELLKRLDALRDGWEKRVLAGGKDEQLTKLYDAARELEQKIEAELPKAEAKALETGRLGFERSIGAFVVDRLQQSRDLVQDFRASNPSLEAYQAFSRDIMALNKEYIAEPRKSDDVTRQYVGRVQELVAKYSTKA